MCQDEVAMYFRKKKSGKYEYLQIVEGRREGGKVRQQALLTLGTCAEWLDGGKLDALLVSGARLSDKAALLLAHQAGESEPVSCERVGPDLVFGRLWRELHIGEAIRSLAAGNGFKFDVERAVYRAVIHRLFRSGSDRASMAWADDYRLPGTERLQLHHCYRAMGFLGRPTKDQALAVKFAPRCVKDQVEEMVFDARRDLFSELSMVFFDTTSVYFEGAGGESFGEYGYSKDHRPDRRQMVVGVVVDGGGVPLCCEMWPGNTTDVVTIKEVVNRFQKCFGIKEVCIVSDRGMISADMLKFLDSPDCSFTYILGARTRKVKEVKEEVLSRAGRYHKVEPTNPRHEPLKVKDVVQNERRYVVCVNEAQARKDAHDRELIVASSREKLKAGDKALVGNSGYRKYLKSGGKGRFEIDEEKLREEARFDGKWVLTTNTALDPEEVALKYKQLWMVGATFRAMKSGMDTRPIFHHLDRTIRGHVFCSFLALLLRRELERRLAAKGHKLEWADILRDLDAAQEVSAEISGKKVIFRSELRGCAGKVMQAVGVAPPPTLRFV